MFRKTTSSKNKIPKFSRQKLKITDHFTMREVTESYTATRLGIDNSLPSELLPNVIKVAEKILEPTRLYFSRPIKVSSWYRSVELNKTIGGSAKSDHCKGCAVDFEIAGLPNKQLAIFIRDNLEFRQLILEFYDPKKPNSGWVHCSYVEGDNKKEVLRTQDGKTYHKGLY